ncbi:phage holin family protein [Georgenia sp. TF02-10]|uniref:phage holin family protein n=1 Tax=Georgenia sp. TF02-10 TaxID=2917725 RepID=UPI001FA7F56D|nr:phage holin family protein [Georgenia sp. TF02-10]UNX54763.1 phage holin family protein [Georgenia sp. TF02-10]
MSTPYEPDPRGQGAYDAGAYAAGGRDGDNASVGELFSRVSEDLSTLVRQEIALAKAETTQSAKQAGKGAGMFAGAAWSTHFVLLFLSLALWWALGAMIGAGDAQPALGWSALIVAVIWAIIAAVLALTGRREVQRVRGLPQTAETVKKIPDALKGQEQQ